MRLEAPVLCLILIAMLAGCTPEQRCGGALYYDALQESCRPCPAQARFERGTCECPEDYVFTAGSCRLRDGATPDAGSDQEDAGATIPAAESCGGYCYTMRVCIADNDLAQRGLADVIAALHAADQDACRDSCETALGATTNDDVTACIDSERDQAACAGDDTQDGLQHTLTLLGTCCFPQPEHPLCRAICTALEANPYIQGNAVFCP